jgi:hypothetical protein
MCHSSCFRERLTDPPEPPGLFEPAHFWLISKLLALTGQSHPWSPHLTRRFSIPSLEREVKRGLVCIAQEERYLSGFDLQDDITLKVVGAIAPKLENAEIDRAMRKPTESLDGYDYYLRAMASFHKAGREDIKEAVRLFQRRSNSTTPTRPPTEWPHGVMPGAS